MKSESKNCREKAEEILKGVSISCDRWQYIVTAIEAGENPQLDSKEAEKLVNRGFLIRTYRLGG